MDFILIPGLWLDGSAWTDVAAELERRGHQAIPLTLPGQGDGEATATLEDQLAAVLGAVDGAPDAVVVGHSADVGQETRQQVDAQAHAAHVLDEAVLVKGWAQSSPAARPSCPASSIDASTTRNRRHCRTGASPAPSSMPSTGPFGGEGGVEAFDAAVGLGPVGLGPLVGDVVVEGCGEGVGPVAGAVIIHHGGDGHAQTCEERVCPGPESR